MDRRVSSWYANLYGYYRRLFFKKQRMAKGSMSRRANIIVSVNDNNIERAMRQLKKRSEREGIVRDMKRVIYYEPESQKRRKRMMRAVKQNWIRMATSKLI